MKSAHPAKPILQPDQVVLSTNLFFKINVSLPLVTGELLQNTVDVYRICLRCLRQMSTVDVCMYRILKKLPGNQGERNVNSEE